jgi:hypothetical protein
MRAQPSVRIGRCFTLKVFRVINTHPLVALPPLVIRGGTDADFPACELYRDTLSQNLMKALQKPDNLLRRISLSIYYNNRAFPPTMGELRLSHHWLRKAGSGQRNSDKERKWGEELGRLSDASINSRIRFLITEGHPIESVESGPSSTNSSSWL